MRPFARTGAAVALLAACTCACTSTPSQEALRADLLAGRVAGRLLDCVPAVSQEQREHCGPAALAAVATACGVTASSEQLGADTYLAAAHGSFPFDLERAARRLGLVPRAHYGCSITSLLRWLDAGSPVIVLRKVGAWPWQTYHYQIIDGYDATRELLVLKDARDAGAVISFAELASTWPSRYALVLLREVDIELAARAAHAQAQGRLEDAARCYRAHLDRFPADLEAAYNLAGVELALGHVATAQQRYAAILALYPDDAPTANNLADSLCAHHGDLDQAEILARHALEVDPRNGCYYRATLGEVLRARGAPVEALNELQVALADPRNTDAELRRHLDGLIAELRDATRP